MGTMGPMAPVKKEGKSTFFRKKLNPNAYSFFRKDLMDVTYDLGDVYDHKKVADAQARWEIASNSPYLKHVKALSATWPHLRLLADFMEVSTTPIRWKQLTSPESKIREEREKRAKRTHVARLDYLASGQIEISKYIKSDDLRVALKLTDAQKTLKLARALQPWRHEPPAPIQDSTGAWGSSTPLEVARRCTLRLYVVEDLSRDMIESLGEKFDIDPAFFREQIVDYNWSNIRDRWFDPPNLKMAKTGQKWTPIRFVTARYYSSPVTFAQGCKDAENFNVHRRPDDDLNNFSKWDDEKALIGISRARASLWMQDFKPGSNKDAVGVLLIDPTIKAGTPLWYGYRNWEDTPSYKVDKLPKPPPRDTFFNDLVYWAQKHESFVSRYATPSAHLPIITLLHLICAEWLTMSEYIKTRISQIEWEISVPEHFLKPGTNINDALNKLHMWRRLVPLYREMIAETIQRVSEMEWPTDHIGAQPSTILDSTKEHNTPLGIFGDDFKKALGFMDDFQDRIDRLTSVVTAVISIEDSRHARDDNRNLARLTWLGTFFIPLSYISSLFSMQPDISQLGNTYKLYFAVAFPAAMGAVLLLLVLPFLQNMVIGWFSSSLSWKQELLKKRANQSRFQHKDWK